MTSSAHISKDQTRDHGEKTGRSPVSPLFECFTECPERTITDIKGVIPSWISGALVRIGPGKFKYGKDEFKHWFDGHGIIHKFTVRDSKVTFQSKFVETDAYKNNMSQQRITVAEFGTAATPDPCASKFARFRSWFYNPGSSDNVNVNVFKFGDVLMANTDSPHMQVVTTDLDTVGRLDLTSLISLTLASSHPHYERDGTMYIAGSSYNGRPKIHIVKVPPPSIAGTKTVGEALAKAEVVCTIPTRSAMYPSYSHSFGMTKNYFIYCETPVSMNLFKTLSKCIRGRPINDVFEYDPKEMAVFHVIKKSSGEVLPLKFQVQGLFFWHIINCYEEDSHIVMDLCSFYDFDNSDLFTEPLEEFKNGKWAEEKKWSTYKHHPLRLVFPLRTELTGRASLNLVTLKYTKCKAFVCSKNLIVVEPEYLLPEGEDRIDMPQINYENFNGRKYRYFYGTGLIVNQHFMNGLGKVDVENKCSLKWTGTVDQYPSEPVFVPHPNSQSEDEGVILSSVCDVDPKNRDFLLVLDARTFQELGRAYVPEDVQVPYSMHGSYYKM